jgi:hypothetical protein
VPSALSSNGDAFVSHKKVPMNDEDSETEFPFEVVPSTDADMPASKLVTFSIFNELFNKKICQVTKHLVSCVLDPIP